MKKLILILFLLGIFFGQKTNANVCKNTFLDIVPVVQSLGFVVTSTTRGHHNVHSKHYLGKAVDVRTRDKTDEQVHFLKLTIESMGYIFRDERERPLFQKIWHGQHIHIETPNCVMYNTDFIPEPEEMCFSE